MHNENAVGVAGDTLEGYWETLRVSLRAKAHAWAFLGHFEIAENIMPTGTLRIVRGSLWGTHDFLSAALLLTRGMAGGVQPAQGARSRPTLPWKRKQLA